jgi:hypothetical protein
MYPVTDLVVLSGGISIPVAAVYLLVAYLVMLALEKALVVVE